MVELLANGAVRKMKTMLADPVQYTMVLGEHEIPMNQFLGSSWGWSLAALLIV